jgi:hypothetical protein
MKALWTLTLLFTMHATAADLRITELKSEIMILAKASEGKTDLDGKLQDAIEEKVQDLEKILPYQTTEEKAQKILGPWRQVFGPYSPSGDGTIPFGSRTDKIYQIIFPKGIFYNVALFEKANVKLVFLLKGNYKLTDEAIEGIFVKNSIIARKFDESTLYQLPTKVEAGEVSAVNLPNRIPPVGQGGKLFEVYADKDIRILRGQTPQFKRPALYIMERVSQ